MVLSSVTDRGRLCVLLPAETKPEKKKKKRKRALLWQFPFPAGCLHLGTESQHICSLSSELAFVSCFLSYFHLFFLSFPHVCLSCFIVFFELFFSLFKISVFLSARIFFAVQSSLMQICNSYIFRPPPTSHSCFFPRSLSASVARAESYTKIHKQA